MHKTRKSIAKRFKVTGSGKVLRRCPAHRHKLEKKSSKRKRNINRDKSASPGVSAMVRKAVPNAF